jgi:hypothetical protein
MRARRFPQPRSNRMKQVEKKDIASVPGGITDGKPIIGDIGPSYPPFPEIPEYPQTPTVPVVDYTKY